MRAKSAVAGKTWPPQRHRFHQVRFCDLRAGVEISQSFRHPLDPVQVAGKRSPSAAPCLPSLRWQRPSNAPALAGVCRVDAASALGVLLLECGKP